MLAHQAAAGRRTAPPGGTGSALGTSAKSAAARPRARAKSDGDGQARRRRFDWLRHAQSLLWRPELGPDQQHRTAWCHRTLRGERGSLWRSDQAARLAGVTTCGSVWSCPVCSAKVTEVRRRELVRAMADQAKAGGTCNLITVTFAHRDPLEWDQAPDSRPAERLARETELLRRQLDAFALALSRWKGARGYRSAMQAAGRIGQVRSLEVTVGDANGWHPHVHEIAFVERPLAMFRDEVFRQAAARVELDPDDSRHWPRIADELRRDPVGFELAITDEYRELRDGWIGACLRAGLVLPSDVDAMRLRALDIRDGTYAAEYAAKFGREADGWSLASELTRSHAKAGTRLTTAGDHYTPMQLLAFSAEGDAWSGFRWRAFSEVFAGRRMLTWSPGLRRHFGLTDDRTDDELAADDDPLPEEHQVAEVTAEQLRAITARAALGELLTWVHQVDPGQADVDRWIAELVATRPPTLSGTLRARRQFGGGYALMDAAA